MSDRRRTPTRPYARKRGGPPSVTTILDVIGKPGLSWAAAKETALYVAHHIDDVRAEVNANQDAAVDKLRRHHSVLWSARAGVGTALHAVNEAWSWGEDVDLAQVVDTLRDKQKSLWPGQSTDEVVNLLSPYVDGLEAFWNDCDPQTVQTEEVVRTPDLYIGQRDWVCTIDGVRWLLDLKSTAELDPEKGVYADSWRLQLAAYRYATEIVTYDAQGKETGTLPNEDVDRCGIVHFRGDGAFQLIELRCGETEHERFLACRSLYEWVNKDSKKPAPVIVRPELIAAEQRGAA